jgi:histidine triad (HIT) family protein
MKDEKCLFCQIVAGEEPSTKVWENEEFLCIQNKYPVSPIHVLVVPKAHILKAMWIAPLRPKGLRGAKLV